MAERSISPLSSPQDYDRDSTAMSASGLTRSSNSASALRRPPSTGSLSNSSFQRGHSKSRQFSRTSFDGPMPRISEIDGDRENDANHWHAFALVFVALPAIAGLIFENGSAVMTDLLLLGLGCLFLFWSVKWPWEWYKSCQTRVFVDYHEDSITEDMFEAESRTQDQTDDERDGTSLDANLDKDGMNAEMNSKIESLRGRQASAAQTLHGFELMALASCFISPMAVAYLLHTIRPYLSRPSGGLVSNSNLTLFTLAAEVRPILHLFKLIEARTLHLQKVVQTAEPTSIDIAQDEKIEDLLKRISSLESGKNSQNEQSQDQDQDQESAPTASKLLEVELSIKQTLQPQVDALNRAVRRYEKRATMQSLVLETRLRDLDRRVDDSLSLAAAASRYNNNRGLRNSISVMISSVLNSITNLISLPAKAITALYTFLLGPRRKKVKSSNREETKTGKKVMKVKGVSNGR